MKLNIFNRITKGKNDSKRSRREGKIPAVLYVRGKPSESILIDAAELAAHMRQVEQGCLATVKFTLVGEDGKERLAIIKDIQYDIITYKAIHLDFEELFDDVKIKVNVPIVCTGAMDCAGIKLGGVLRQVIRHLRVQCLPKDLPTTYEIDVRPLAMNDSKKLKDLVIAPEVKPLTLLDQVAVVIAKR